MRLAPFERVGAKGANFFGNGKCELKAQGNNRPGVTT